MVYACHVAPEAVPLVLVQRLEGLGRHKPDRQAPARPLDVSENRGIAERRHEAHLRSSNSSAFPARWPICSLVISTTSWPVCDRLEISRLRSEGSGTDSAHTIADVVPTACQEEKERLGQSASRHRSRPAHGGALAIMTLVW